MKLFCASDLHSYFTPFKKALAEKGFEPNNPEHLLVICGDCFDRGSESVELYEFLNNLSNVVLVRGNHEDLLQELLARGYGERHDHSNGTTRTVVDLCDITNKSMNSSSEEICAAVKELITPFLNKFVNYFETKNYIFVHGWIPCDLPSYVGKPWWQNNRKLVYNTEWRSSSEDAWYASRWINGIDAGYLKKVIEPGKTIVCGHWHCSYGHYWKAVRKSIESGNTIFEAEASEFGNNAVWEPFEAEGIIAIDACTAHTGKVNVVVLEDELLPKEY